MLHLEIPTLGLFIAVASGAGSFVIWSLNRLVREHDANCSEVTKLRERVIVLEQTKSTPQLPPPIGRNRR